jgi:hypothetical protein
MTITYADGTVVAASWSADRSAPIPEESHFICSEVVARQLIGNLMSGSKAQDDGANPFYVFSAEKGRVRVTVLRRTYRKAG